MNRKILTLCIVHQDDRVLLGMKKRGFGMGKWNGFGGKVQENESIEAAAKRELFEEANIQVQELEQLGLLDFSWSKNPDQILQVNIFKATQFTGIPTETEEMKPEWFSIKDIPYEKMWADDIHWIPLFLENKKFKGNFIFDDNNNVLEYRLD